MGEYSETSRKFGRDTGMWPKEFAKKVGLPVSTVNNHLRRGHCIIHKDTGLGMSIHQFAKLHNLNVTLAYRQFKQGYCAWPPKWTRQLTP